MNHLMKSKRLKENLISPNFKNKLKDHPNKL